jgi:hypothetical protein
MAAPTSASVVMKSSPSAAARRTGAPTGACRRASQGSMAAPIHAKPEVTRCASSMTVLVLGWWGSTTPWHSGQWSPQPSPLKLART